MISFPDSIHPLIVHFPIVMILLGSLGCIIIFYKPNLSKSIFLSTFWLLAAISTTLAINSGMDDASKLKTKEPVTTILDEHADWAETTNYMTWLTAFLIITGTILHDQKKIFYTILSVALLLSFVCVYAMVETGIRGALMVHDYHISTMK